jgi:(4-(4-[2-(gamma-L-glutamylamino)ethyl]phenoxymethyl)furan-2-yl)methanamine synthase
MIGWDIGGAHLKAARLDSSGSVERVVQLPCLLWQGMHHLHSALEQALSELGPATGSAVTMTGEMVDLFPSRDEGVRQLVTAVADRVPSAPLRFYAGADGFLEAGEALNAGRSIASANWMATAALVAARLDHALLVDVGSTTTDLVPVVNRRVAARGTDDATRLVCGELIYTGIVRTPIMALAERVPFEGQSVPLMAEHFATTADLYRLTAKLPDGADQHPAADGGEKTIPASARRLARMLGRDRDTATAIAWRELAEWLIERQTLRIKEACERLLSREGVSDDSPLVAAGVGRFLVVGLSRQLHRRHVDFASLVPHSANLANQVANCAPAVAVAWLAQRTSLVGN